MTALNIHDVLSAIDDLGPASVELIAWELGAEEPEIEALWEHAAIERLISYVGVDEYGERMHRLTIRGRTELWRSRAARDEGGSLPAAIAA